MRTLRNVNDMRREELLAEKKRLLRARRITLAIIVIGSILWFGFIFMLVKYGFTELTDILREFIRNLKQ